MPGGETVWHRSVFKSVSNIVLSVDYDVVELSIIWGNLPLDKVGISSSQESVFTVIVGVGFTVGLSTGLEVLGGIGVVWVVEHHVLAFWFDSGVGISVSSPSGLGGGHGSVWEFT